ncbi:hypothetical protein Glove_161g54 [Diversispora epigaea]|uniref:Uncharacterized protein n=1 Tax=Diversispora epigaea TaxID=1348612 RepID=A0A397IRD3_9GLOM|nr:hypothetical protein Glove_161g54 [Diversispora epigaea]
MADTQPTIESLRELNTNLVLQINELKKKFAEVEAENIKLKQSLEEYAVLKIRFDQLEKKNKADTINLTAENIELKDRVTKLEQSQKQQVSTLVPQKHSSANIDASCGTNSEGNPKQDSGHDNTSAPDISVNGSNSDEHQKETSSRVSNSSSTKLSICVKPKSLEDKEMDNFLV